MTIIDFASRNYRQPIDRALEIAKNENCSFGESVKARCLFVAQLVVSAIATPFLILGILFSGTFRKFNIDIHASPALTRALTVDIPGSFIGFFAPLSKSVELISDWDMGYNNEALSKLRFLSPTNSRSSSPHIPMAAEWNEAYEDVPEIGSDSTVVSGDENSEPDFVGSADEANPPYIVNRRGPFHDSAL